jgi:hypothetical protein
MVRCGGALFSLSSFVPSLLLSLSVALARLISLSRTRALSLASGAPSPPYMFTSFCLFCHSLPKLYTVSLPSTTRGHLVSCWRRSVGPRDAARAAGAHGSALSPGSRLKRRCMPIATPLAYPIAAARCSASFVPLIAVPHCSTCSVPRCGGDRIAKRVGARHQLRGGRPQRRRGPAAAPALARCRRP